MSVARWRCLECGWRFASARSAQRAAFGDDGCPGCGGVDVDLVTDEQMERIRRDDSGGQADRVSDEAARDRGE